ncbi:enoyl-CoA hydratase [Neptuniibacter sp. PT8_73]|uniref:enoyl-CoA hydratase n=1 Tax=Neptuniibacter sp. PT8_73 TaxID=3398206 RepID=UPI0039F4CA8B
MTDKLIVEKHGHTAVITMNNPPANTWTEESLDGLVTVVDELNQDKQIYALVLRSTSEKFFSAGADLNLFADGDRAIAREMASQFGRAFESLSKFRGVSIAAINGFAMGGGLEVALACDIRVAEEQAQMALPEATVGLLPCAGGTQNLTMLVGEGWAKRMILCGERIKAPQAKGIGLVEELVPQGQAYDKAMELAKAVEKQSPTAIAACKQLIQNNRTHHWDAGYRLERELFVDLFHTEDQKEGVNAFLGKRAPEWKNQ